LGNLGKVPPFILHPSSFILPLASLPIARAALARMRDRNDAPTALREIA
jgi:hypothetical protein